MRSAFILMAFMLGFAHPLGAEEITSTLARIKESGSVRIGYRESEPPFSFLDKEGNPVGYSIDLCNLIVEDIKTGVEDPELSVEYVAVTASNRFEALNDGTIDILCGATTRTLSRGELVDFTLMTFITGASLLSLEATKVTGIADLKGKKVAVSENTTTIDALKAALEEQGVDAEVVPVESAAEGLAALKSGDVQAFSADQVVLIGLIVTNEDPEKLHVAEELFSLEPFALAVRRNDADFRLLADRTLAQLYQSGEIGPIYDLWFGRFSKDVPTLVEAMFIVNTVPE